MEPRVEFFGRLPGLIIDTFAHTLLLPPRARRARRCFRRCSCGGLQKSFRPRELFFVGPRMIWVFFSMLEKSHRIPKNKTNEKSRNATIRKEKTTGRREEGDGDCRVTDLHVWPAAPYKHVASLSLTSRGPCRRKHTSGASRTWRSMSTFPRRSIPMRQRPAGILMGKKHKRVVIHAWGAGVERGARDDDASHCMGRKTAP